MYIALWENSRGHPDNVSFMQFSTKIDGFEQKDSQGFENSYNSWTIPIREIFHFHHLPKLYFGFNSSYCVAFLRGKTSVLEMWQKKTTMFLSIQQGADPYPFLLHEWPNNDIHVHVQTTLHTVQKRVQIHMLNTVYYISYQDCPIDFHILHSELFHDHVLVPPTITWLPVRYASVYIIHTLCVAQSAARCTVKSELGQWIRRKMSPLGARELKRNLDLMISVFHCHSLRAQLLAAHTAAHQS